MTPNAFIKIIEAIKYKPEGDIWACKDWTSPELIRIGIFHKTSKLETGEPTFRGYSSSIHPKQFNNDKEILSYVRKLFIKLEIHEMDEWISYRNKRVFDPHKNERPHLRNKRRNNLWK